MDDRTEDEERVKIREELSSLSFEDLQKLKEKLGTKVYNQTIFGVKKEKTSSEFKRANKNRPREESSKKKVPPLREVVPIKKNTVCDPRFDSSCGTFNEEAFKNAYSFINDIKQNEKQQLYKELKKTPNQERKKEIKYLIQRIENQEREEKIKQKKKEKLQQEKEEQIQSLRQGKKPQFIKKSERKVLDLVERYEELKETGKLKKHIEKRNKKLLNKDRKRYTLDRTE
ncbi:ribosomal RNA processing protein 36 homolog [Macrosteles quadrilineatus]|uniref:ribosomal RNA processing protein 36 homolog n=1 Tax=Macrosteles quadrilineatus TaxID=74068 RepID=UPI0023E1065B|nr:ribosomal RNA processing protein 36 homolog [Macrosteles quadrilineatus]XP_054264924.1 ribosomal RNA processing protein 36 homolog [Macrosteles quadrilineatus]XP_054264925.1 ribosomal RNA processing protein 36 homolog [Macrosteles quadrilineatus]XP_054264926.1 ribosomal RNA processing protein 36 homolog [Macrosteles quadrilineatus]